MGDANSGIYNIYKERMTIFQALAMSGDLLNSGDRRHVRIIRPKGNGEPEVLEFDIRTNTIIDSKYYYVYPND
jgi:polysaccharide export outer membrane protein